jgi:signal transduction histidine kinase
VKLSIRVAGVVLLFTLAVSLALYVAGAREERKILADVSESHIQQLQGSLEDLQREDVRMLSSVLEAIVRDAGLQETFLRGDREALYAAAEPLFRTLKERHGITHLYFILPDRSVFLRVHDQRLHGDIVGRRSLAQAMATQKPAWEMGLGRTAFALRVVTPYRHGGAVVGYVELGEEVDRFLGILTHGTANELALVADKSGLDHDDWKSVRREAGLPDSWDEMQKHLVLSATSARDLMRRCLAEENLDRVERGERLFGQVRGGGRTFACGGFELRAADGGHVGALLSLVDITEHAAEAQRGTRSVLLTACALFAVAFPAGLLLSRSFTRPIEELCRVAGCVTRGDLGRRAAVGRADEIGRLAEAINGMIDRRQAAEEELRRSHDDLERLVARRSADLEAANRRLHELSGHLQGVREEERTRVAREIHDELGQSLTAMRMELSLLRRGLPGDQRQNIERADSLNALVDSTTQAVKRISQDLRPGILDHLGLSAAVEWQAEEFERRTGIPCDVTVEPGEIVIDEERSTAVFRVLQEALTNVARHAQAREVSVLLRRDAAGLVLQVRDDGRGMEERRSPGRRFGIIGIQERVRAWGGSVEIASVSGAGTTVTVRLPSDGGEGAS